MIIMRITKKYLAIALAILMAVSMMPFSAFAADAKPSATKQFINAEDLVDMPTANGPISFDFGYRFTAKHDATTIDSFNSKYKYYAADYVIKADQDVAPGAITIGGQWDGNSSNWVTVTPTETLTANTEIRLLQTILTSQGYLNPGDIFTYEDIAKIVHEFTCAIKMNDQSAKGTNITVELRLYETEEAEVGGDTVLVEKDGGEVAKITNFTLEVGETYVVNGTGALPADQIGTTYKVKVTSSTGVVTYSKGLTSLTNGSTYQLLDDVTASRICVGSATASGTATLDLNGHDLTTTVASGNSFSSIYFHTSANNCDLAIINTSENPSEFNASNDISVARANAQVTIGTGVTVNGSIAGNSTSDGTTVNIYGTINGGNNTAIYQPQDGVLNVYEGATVKGATGIYAKAGTINVYGGTVEGDGEYKDFVSNNSSAVSDGSAIILDHKDNSTTYGDHLEAHIYGGTIRSANNVAVESQAGVAGQTPIDEVIPADSTAVFSSDVSDLAEEGYKTVYDAEKGGYVVEELDPLPVATVEALSDAQLTDQPTIPAGGSQAVDVTYDYGYQFTAEDDATSVQSSDYRYYAADFVISSDTDLPAGSVTLAGNYGNYGWISLTPDTTVTAETDYKLLEMLNDEPVNYEFICSEVSPFKCAVKCNDPAAAGANITIELVIYKATLDEEGKVVIVDETPEVIAVETDQLAYVDPAYVNGANFTIDSGITTNLYFDADYPEEYTAEINYNHASNVSETDDFYTDVVTLGSLNVYEPTHGDDPYAGAYMFSVTQAPAQLSEAIDVTIRDNEYNVVKRMHVVPSEVIVGQIEALSNSADNVRLVMLYEALLDYGFAAQNYFSYNLSNPIEEEYSINDVTDLEEIPSTGGSTTMSKLAGISMVVTSDLGVNIYTTEPVEVLGVTTAGESEITAEYGTNEGRYYIAVRGIAAADLGQNFTVTTDDGTITISAFTAARSILAANVSPEYNDLARAVYVFGCAAEGYFGYHG